MSSYGTLAWFFLLCQGSSFSPFTLFSLALSPSTTFLIHLLLQPLLYFTPSLNSLCAPHSNTCSQPCFPTVFPSFLLSPPLFLYFTNSWHRSCLINQPGQYYQLHVNKKSTKNVSYTVNYSKQQTNKVISKNLGVIWQAWLITAALW